MKVSRAWLLLLAAGALAASVARALNIDYTVTGLTAWNGGLFENAKFDPLPDHPFRMTFSLTDQNIFSLSTNTVELTGVSAGRGVSDFSIPGAPPPGLGMGPDADIFLQNPATSGGRDLDVQTGTPLFRAFFGFSGPALFHNAANALTFETGRFDLTGELGILNPGVTEQEIIRTPLAEVVLTAQPVPEAASGLLVASGAVGLGGVCGLRRWRLLRWQPFACPSVGLHHAKPKNLQKKRTQGLTTSAS